MNIIPNWHPILVHFTIALLTVSTVLYVFAFLIKTAIQRERCLIVAEWNFWIGSGFTILTLLAGWYAYNTVAHDTASHIAMTEHRNWAWATAGLILILCVWLGLIKRASKPTNGLFLVFMLGMLFLLMATAWHGSEIVYRHGLGVMSLPTIDDHAGTDSEGHNHKHHAIEEDRSSTPDTHDHDQQNDSNTHEHSQDQQDDSHVDDHDHDHDHQHNHNHKSASIGQPEKSTTVVNTFHQAMNNGDALTLRKLIGDAILIFENGNVERSADEYASHHMKADIEFMQKMKVTQLEQHTQQLGDMAYVSSRSRIRGHFNGKDLDYSSLETMILEKQKGEWRIVHIHWSQ